MSFYPFTASVYWASTGRFHRNGGQFPIGRPAVFPPDRWLFLSGIRTKKTARADRKGKIRFPHGIQQAIFEAATLAKKPLRKGGGKAFAFHGIRHLTASLLAERNIPLVEIQHHLRHDHLSTTERYIHQLQKNRVAIDALPGLEDASEKCGPYEARKKETAC